MQVSALDFVDGASPLLLLPVSQIRTFAAAINRATTRHVAFVNAIHALHSKRRECEGHIELSNSDWSDFLECLNAATTEFNESA